MLCWDFLPQVSLKYLGPMNSLTRCRTRGCCWRVRGFIWSGHGWEDSFLVVYTRRPEAVTGPPAMNVVAAAWRKDYSGKSTILRCTTQTNHTSRPSRLMIRPQKYYLSSATWLGHPLSDPRLDWLYFYLETETATTHVIGWHLTQQQCELQPSSGISKRYTIGGRK